MMEVRTEPWRSRYRNSGISASALVALCLVCIGAGMLLLFVNPVLVLAGVLGLAVLWAAFKQPYYGIIFYLILEYVRPGDMAPALESLHLNRMIVLVTTLGWFAWKLRNRSSKVVWTAQSWAVAGFTGVMILSIPTAVWTGRAIEFTIDGIKMAFVFFLITNLLTTTRRIRGFILVFIALAVWLAADAVVSYVATGKPARGATGGFLGDENDLAMALLVALPIAASLYNISAGRKLRIASVTAFMLIVWGVIFTFSRGAFLTLVCVLLGMASLVKRRAIALSAIALIIIILWLAAPPQYHERIATITQYRQDESAQGRTLAWHAAVNMFRDRPFFGVGPGNFETAYGLFYKPPGAQAIWRAAHSVYFQCLGELGAFGCLFFGLIVGLTLRDLFRLRHAALNMPGYRWIGQLATGMAVGLFAYLVSGAFLSALYYPHPYFLAALTASLVNVSNPKAAMEREVK